MADSYKKSVLSWCFYDWANSAFATTVMAAFFPPFFRELALAAGVEAATATAYWGYKASFAMLLVAVMAPMLGAMADHTRSRVRSVGIFTATGVVFTACFAFIAPGAWKMAALLFIGANLGFAGANIFYESLLPSVARYGDADRVSALGYALGYVGGGLLLAINMAMVLKWEMLGFHSALFALKASFFTVALWWGAFSVPLIKNVPEPGGKPITKNSFSQVASAGFARLAGTFSQIRRYRQLMLFLAAFWLYNDGISTIIKMATAYGSEIGIGVGHMAGALVITQFVGIFCTLLFGRAAKVFGAKPCVLAGLGVYAVICILGYWMRVPWHFFLLAAAVGTVQGGCQALSRSIFAVMTPRHRAAEFFGFFSTSSKMAGIFGPLVFGIVAQMTGQARFSIVALIFFFVAGGLLLSRVDVKAGEKVARDAEEQEGAWSA